MNTQRIAAIFEKDLKDFMKNMMLLVTPLLPIVMALFYSQMVEGDANVMMLYIIIGMSLSGVTTSMIMTMMAEENEKKTLRGLIQSPASFIDIIIGKSLVTAIVTFVSLGIAIFIYGMDQLQDVRAILGLLLLFIFFLLVGIGLGLFVKTVASTYVYIMPIMFVFGLTPFLSTLDFFTTNDAANSVIQHFPLSQAIGIHDTNSWLPLGVISIWVLVAAIVVYICFKKTTTDD